MCSHRTRSADIGFSGGGALALCGASRASVTSSASAGLATPSVFVQVIASPLSMFVTVMVAPGRRIAHRTPARYETVMVPKTVMVEPEGVQYEDVPPQYATVQRTEMVAPARAYMVPVRPRCGNCGW